MSEVHDGTKAKLVLYSMIAAASYLQRHDLNSNHQSGIRLLLLFMFSFTHRYVTFAKWKFSSYGYPGAMVEFSVKNFALFMW